MNSNNALPKTTKFANEKKQIRQGDWAHLTAPREEPASSPWMSRLFSLTKVLSLTGVAAANSLRLDGDPTLPLVDADCPPENAGVAHDERPPPPAGLGRVAVDLFPSSFWRLPATIPESDRAREWIEDGTNPKRQKGNGTERKQRW